MYFSKALGVVFRCGYGATAAAAAAAATDIR